MGVILSCKKINLDPFAFPAQKLGSYQFENYSGGEITIDEAYAIDGADRTLITLTSVDKSTNESYTIYGVYIGDLNTISTDTVVLYLHGQALHMDHYWTRAALLANVGGKLNHGVLMIDYRGYGMSEGTSSEQGLYEDTDAAISWLKEHGVTGERMVYYGFSLGAIPAIDRAAYRNDIKPYKLIIESPLASVEHLVQSSTLINIDPGFVTTLEFNNAEKIKDVSADLMWLHGKEDTYISIDNGELIYNNHNTGSKIAYRIDNSGHSGVPPKMGFENYLEALTQFYKQ